MNVVLLAARPTPPELSAALPLQLAGAPAAPYVLPLAGVVTDAVIGLVLSSVKVTTAPVNVLPALSVAVAFTVNVPSLCEDQVGKVALLVHVTAVLLVVAAWVVARLAAPDCQAEPVQ